MKVTNYRLQTQMENINPLNTEWFKEYLRAVLESDKKYYEKADYIGLSIQELQNKIDYLAEDIKEMTALKKKLTLAKTVVLEATAEVLGEYGIDRLDGTAISSITITQAKTNTKETLIILDEKALIELGYFKVELDEVSIKEAMLTKESMDEMAAFVKIGLDSEEIPARIKVNAKRNCTNTQADELLGLVEAA